MMMMETMKVCDDESNIVDAQHASWRSDAASADGVDDATDTGTMRLCR